MTDAPALDRPAPSSQASDWAGDMEQALLDQARVLAPTQGWTWPMARAAGRAMGLSAAETELASRLTAWQDTHGLEPAAPIPQQVRSQLRTELGREWFLAERGVPPGWPADRKVPTASAGARRPPLPPRAFLL